MDLMRRIHDVAAWFAEMDREAAEPFMENREQPDTPVGHAVADCEPVVRAAVVGTPP
jgi:hypothetical protein